MKKHKAQLTISKPTFGDGREAVCIAVKDVDAGVTFLELEMGLKDFAECLMGLSKVSAEMEVRGLDKVGKKIQRAELEVGLPAGAGYSDRKRIAANAVLEQAPSGWTPSTYFGSKASFYSKDGKDFARTTMSRWVDKDEG